MRATEFEYRHQVLLHQLIISAAFLMYLVARDDIVWKFIKGSTIRRELEHSLFLVATLFIGAAAGICTWARAYPKSDMTGYSESILCDGPYRYLRYSQYLGDLLYGIGLASLVPLGGFVILVTGEAIRVLRLIQREDALRDAMCAKRALSSGLRFSQSDRPSSQSSRLGLQWRSAFQQEAVKWGLFFTMIVFTITLKDSLAEFLAGASVLVSILLHWPLPRKKLSES